MNRTRSLFTNSVLVIFFFAVGKVTGLLRTRMISTTFGTGSDVDAFAAANQLPEVFFVVIAGGSLAAAFIPVYSQYLGSESSRKAARLANTTLTLVIVLLGSISLLGAIFAPWLTRVVLVPDFPPEQQALTAEIMRIILIQITIFGVAGLLSSILNAHQHFAVPALSSITLDIGYFIGILFLVPAIGVVGLAWGTVIGALIQVVIQLPVLRRHGVRLRPALAIRMRGIHEIIRLMIPRIVTLGAVQAADIFIVRLASGLAVGSMSGYFYAFSLMQFPETLFGTAIALVVFPTMAEYYNAGDVRRLSRLTAQTLSTVWFLTIPSAVGILLLGRPLVSVLLQGGAFDEGSAALVYLILTVFALRVVSEATVDVLARHYYAQHNTLTPMVTFLGWFVVNVGVAYLLVDRWGIVALAMASTIAFTVLAIALFALDYKKLVAENGRFLAAGAARSLAGAGGMAVAIYALGQVLQNAFLYLVVGAALGALVYLVLTLLLGGREIPNLIAIVRGAAPADERETTP